MSVYASENKKRIKKLTLGQHCIISLPRASARVEIRSRAQEVQVHHDKLHRALGPQEANAAGRLIYSNLVPAHHLELILGQSVERRALIGGLEVESGVCVSLHSSPWHDNPWESRAP